MWILNQARTKRLIECISLGGVDEHSWMILSNPIFPRTLAQLYSKIKPPPRYFEHDWLLVIRLVDIRITLNKRLDTAAAAMVQRIINRKRPRVLRPVSPFRKGSMDVDVIPKGQREVKESFTNYPGVLLRLPISMVLR